MNEDREIKILIVFLFIIVPLMVGVACSVYKPQSYYYEYVDLDNNTGEAVKCSYNFVQGKAGGQGSPICILPEGTVIQVKQYTKIIKE